MSRRQLPLNLNIPHLSPLLMESISGRHGSSLIASGRMASQLRTQMHAVAISSISGRNYAVHCLNFKF